MKFFIFSGLIAALTYADHRRGPIFPADWYCHAGVGLFYAEPSQTRATGWSSSGSCRAYDPQCATTWTTTPARSICFHSSVWSGIKGHYNGTFERDMVQAHLRNTMVQFEKLGRAFKKDQQ